MRQLSTDKLYELEKEFLADKKNIVAMNASVQSGIRKVATDINKIKENPYKFNIDINNGDVCNQKASGRCWMFASLNFMRNVIIKKYKLENFELSQSYPFFFDKLERSNYYFETVIEKADEPIGDRVMQYLMGDPLCDGGQWDMFVNIVNKYGLVPKYVYPETVASSNTRELNKYLSKILRKNTVTLREAVKKGKSKAEVNALKEAALQDVFNVLTATLGELPETFDFIAHDKDHKLIEEKNLTPQSFFKKYVGLNLDDFVSIINAPTKDKPFNKTFTIKYLGNIVEGREVKHLNLKIEDLKKAIVKQLQDGMPVWFGCDVGKDMYRGEKDDKRATLAKDVIDYETLFDIDLEISKEDGLDYGYSLMTHAMTFTGVEMDGTKPVRFKVENSWGDDFGYKGHFVMSDAWFDSFVYQAVVNKKYLTKKEQEDYKKSPIVLKPWDPMGSLA